jgi:hypothetical protein
MPISASHRFISRASTHERSSRRCTNVDRGDLRQRRPAAITDHHEGRVIGASRALLGHLTRGPSLDSSVAPRA